MHDAWEYLGAPAGAKIVTGLLPRQAASLAQGQLLFLE
jgi:hypothetical protein